MTKKLYNILLVIISIFLLIFIADGNTSSIHSNPDTSVSENDTSDVDVNKTTISDVNDTEPHKSKVSIKIYRTPKKISGFDIISIISIIVLIYHLKTKKR